MLPSASVTATPRAGLATTFPNTPSFASPPPTGPVGSGA
jgi:hypothetical protein